MSSAEEPLLADEHLPAVRLSPAKEQPSEALAPHAPPPVRAGAGGGAAASTAVSHNQAVQPQGLLKERLVESPSSNIQPRRFTYHGEGFFPHTPRSPATVDVGTVHALIDPSVCLTDLLSKTVDRLRGPARRAPASQRSQRHEVTPTSKLGETQVHVRQVAKLIGRARVKCDNPTSVLIITKARDPQLVTLTRELTLWLTRYGDEGGLNVYVDENLRKSRRFDYKGMIRSYLVKDKLHFWNPDLCATNPSIFNFVVTLGGDGTVLFASWLFQRVVPPVIPFSLGSLGFLTNFQYEDHRAVLSKAVSSGVRVNLRMRFTCTIYRCDRTAETEMEAKRVAALVGKSVRKKKDLTRQGSADWQTGHEATNGVGRKANERARSMSTSSSASSSSLSLFTAKPGTELDGSGLLQDPSANLPNEAASSQPAPESNLHRRRIEKRGPAPKSIPKLEAVHTSPPSGQIPGFQSDHQQHHNQRRNVDPTVYATMPCETFEILNDLVVDRGPSPYMSMLELFGDDRHLTTVQADGLCVATPTGSTAYSLAAGGSLVHPEISAMLISPICPHTLSFRPMLLPDSMELRVCVPPGSRSTAWASFDGRGRVELKQGDYIKITASGYPLPTVCAGTQSDDWFRSLNRCLRWNERRLQRAFVCVESPRVPRFGSEVHQPAPTPEAYPAAPRGPTIPRPVPKLSSAQAKQRPTVETGGAGELSQSAPHTARSTSFPAAVFGCASDARGPGRAPQTTPIRRHSSSRSRQHVHRTHHKLANEEEGPSIVLTGRVEPSSDDSDAAGEAALSGGLKLDWPEIPSGSYVGGGADGEDMYPAEEARDEGDGKDETGGEEEYEEEEEWDEGLEAWDVDELVKQIGNRSLGDVDYSPEAAYEPVPESKCLT